MPDQEAFRQRVKKLLAQDQDINDTQLKEFRMSMETTLESWEERSQKVRRWLLRAVVILVFTYVLGFTFIPMFQLGQGAMAGTPMGNVYAVVIGMWFVTASASLVAAIWLAIVYLSKYAPALKRARFDVQTAMLLELQEQVVQLRSDLASGKK